MIPLAPTTTALYAIADTGACMATILIQEA